MDRRVGMGPGEGKGAVAGELGVWPSTWYCGWRGGDRPGEE